jgi:hypothetical protein
MPPSGTPTGGVTSSSLSVVDVGPGKEGGRTEGDAGALLTEPGEVDAETVGESRVGRDGGGMSGGSGLGTLCGAPGALFDIDGWSGEPPCPEHF